MEETLSRSTSAKTSTPWADDSRLLGALAGRHRIYGLMAYSVAQRVRETRKFGWHWERNRATSETWW